MGACGAKSKHQQQQNGNQQVRKQLKQEKQDQFADKQILSQEEKKEELEQLAYQISLKIILPSSQKLTISINTTESIAMMKQIIYHKVMDPQFTEIENPELDILFPYEQRAYCLLRSQDPLDNTKNLQECQIKQDDEIIIQKIEKQQQNEQITLYCSVYIDPYFGLVPLVCSLNDTCQEIYEQLARQLNCKTEELQIYYDLNLQTQLEPQKMLKDYNIQQESTVSALQSM